MENHPRAMRLAAGRARGACAERAGFAALGLLSLALAQPASAQVSGSLRVASDDRWRGRSMSAGRPVAAATIAYDAPDGGYIDAAGTATWARGDVIALTGGAIDAGYAWRASNGVAIDIGAARQQFTRFSSGGRATGFSEVYGGITGRSLAGRLSYSPKYFVRGSRTVYANIEAVARPATGWRLTAHAGALVYITLPPARVGRTVEYDYSIGAVRRFKAIELQLNLSSGGPSPDNYGGRVRSRTALVAAAMVAF
ncbi:TorF family putative porin [Sphingomonas sp. GB1N7]|uniref:TorF family putative porin n=1 Tax=Parasphingomonas caseinilytica TaxID=3096158 RepID=UPI002FCA4836